MKRFLPALLILGMMSFSAGCSESATEALAPDEFSPPPVSGEGTKKERMKEAKDKTAAVESMD